MGRAPGWGLFRGAAVVLALVVLVLALFQVPTGSAIAIAPAPAGPELRSAEVPATPGSGTACYGRTFPSACTAVAAALVPASSSGAVAPQTWDNLTASAGTPPGARWLGSMVWDPIDGYVLLFGGYNESFTSSPSTLYSDSWAFVHGHWSELSASGPSGRYAAGIAWDAADGYAVLFGGYNGLGVAYNDTWTYVHDTWTNITSTAGAAPPSRWRFGMTWDAGDGYVLLFGGSNAAENVFYNDTWEFVHGVWTELFPTGHPLLRYRFSMVYDPLDNYTVAFGGCTTSACSALDASTWAYANDSWKALSPTTHPAARIYFAITYSGAAQTVQLFGGSSSVAPEVALSDTWNFTGGNWTSIGSALPTSPKALAYTSMAYDPVDHYTVLFGGARPDGSDYFFTNQTWALGPSLIGSVATSPGVVDLHQSTAINATPQAYSHYVNYTYTELPPGCTAGNVSEFSCTPNEVGSFPIQVTVNDSLGVPQVENGTVAVNPDPAIVSFTALHANLTIGTRTSFNVTLVNGSLPYTYHYTGLPTGCASANTDNLSCTPNGPAGAYRVEVQVSDAARYSVYSNLSGTVNPLPDVTSMVAVPATLDVNQSLSIRTTEVGGTGPLTYTYSGLPAGCSPSNGPEFNCTPTKPYNGLVSVNVSDAYGWYSNRSVPLLVDPDPTILSSAASPVAFDVGTAVHLWANATGGTGTLTYTYLNLPTGCSPSSSGLLTCTPLESGNFTVTVRVTDTVAEEANATLSFRVNPALALSQVAATPGTVDLGQAVSLDATPTGGTAPYAFAYRGLPAGCAASATSAWTNCTPTRSGTFTITATVTDASGQSQSAAGTLVVKIDPSVNLTVSANSVTVGTSITILAGAGNGTGVYTFAYSGLPSGCSSSNSSSITCTPKATGSFNLGVTVTDSAGLAASAHTNLTVSSPASSSVLGLPAVEGYAVIGVIVLVVLIAVAFLVLRRRTAPPTPPAAETPEPWTEDPPEPNP